ncbi:RNase H family protein, partial [Comamonas aquatica]
WKALESAASRHDVQWHWIRGHSGDPGNERADALANLGIESLRPIL